MNEVKKYKIQLEIVRTGDNATELGIRRSDGIIAESYDRDFYITVPIFKDLTLDDYVDVEIDPLRLQVERQLINPYFIELGFFETINSVDKKRAIDRTSVVGKAGVYDIGINE